MRKDAGRIISTFINQALNNQPIAIYGKDKQSRSLMYIDDLIKALLKLINTNYKIPINLGTPIEYSVLEIGTMINKLLNNSIIYSELPQDDPLKHKPNITRAKQLLDWNPKINLIEGLKQTINFYKNELN